MAVEHAFRVARGTRGVAERAGCLLVQLRPLKISALSRHDLFIAEHVRPIGLRHVLAGGHDDPALNTRALASDALDQRPEVGIKKDVAIFSMVDDVDDLFREQPRIDRVTNKARAGGAVIGLHVPVVVPRQRGDAIALLQIPGLHGIGQLPGAEKTVSIGIAVARIIPGN